MEIKDSSASDFTTFLVMVLDRKKLPGRAGAPGQVHLPRPAVHRSERLQEPGGGAHQDQPQAVISDQKMFTLYVRA